ncbi:hypothetical protein HPP92_019608 [Vanilla planifolia]|uniref:Uncharacterized protein n=1 Tax=Vanilla planifolia TaxID=51239 RepID=A0A835Q6G7_VANPL|nr:hypothetical protein HPP92_020033 [Vanilla planifolia]KAG0465444.1 hypothetical protein HPP92_019608 [Vanilla planifolia]
MAEQMQPSLTTTTQNGTNQPNPTPPQLLARVAAKLNHVGGACFHLLAQPGAAGPVLFTCICLALAMKSRRARNQRRITSLHRSMSLAALQGGHVALRRIIDFQEAQLDKATLECAEEEFRRLLNPSDGRIHFSKLQSVAVKLEMTGKEDKAVALLRKAMEKASGQEAHELGMLLVEMLIYKGDYDEALRCPCLHDEDITDARGPLYKAVIYSIKGDERAEESYKTFQEIYSRLHWPDAFKEETPIYNVVHDFSKFQIIVKNLKKEIEKASENKKR